VPAALEMMDGPTIRAVEASIYAAGYPVDAAAVLLCEVDGLEAGLDADVARIRAHLRGGGRAHGGGRRGRGAPRCASGRGARRRSAPWAASRRTWWCRTRWSRARGSPRCSRASRRSARAGG
jgi:FAD/FMN-containing dehydrogenase